MHKSSWLKMCAKFNKGCDKTENNWMNTYKGCAKSPKTTGVTRVIYKKKEYSWHGSCWSLWPSFCFNIGNKLYVKGRGYTDPHQSIVPSPKVEKWHKYNNDHNHDDHDQHDHQSDDLSYHKSLKSDTDWEYQIGEGDYTEDGDDGFHLIHWESMKPIGLEVSISSNTWWWYDRLGHKISKISTINMDLIWMFMTIMMIITSHWHHGDGHQNL